MHGHDVLTRGSVAGLIAGIWLGLFFKAMEVIFGIKVYTLLLNIDYIPILKELTFPEIVEFSLHLVISIALAIVLLYVIARYKWGKRQIIFRTIVICLVIGAFLYPTTALSERTPPITSISAILFWLLGHILYALVLGVFYCKHK